MKGIIYTELLEFLETNHGYKFANDLIAQSNDPENGAYSSIGYYDDQNLYNLLDTLSDLTNTPKDALLLKFGYHLFHRLAETHPKLIESYNNLFDLLSSLDNTIHVSVNKIYPDTITPRFIVKERTNHKLVMIYKSSRNLVNLAEGLIKGCAAFYGENISIVVNDNDKNSYLFEIFNKSR